MSLMETAQLLGNFGEFVGAIAVVVTLIFLTAQVRLNRVAMRESNAIASAGAVDKIFDQFTGHRRLIASDADVARIWMNGRRGDHLEPIDDLRFQQLALDYMILYSSWAQRGMAIGDREMTTMATRILSNDIAVSPGLDRIWKGGVGVDERFIRAVDHALAEKQAASP